MSAAPRKPREVTARMSFSVPSWMYDAMIFVYALSLLFSFSDVLQTGRIKKRVAMGLLYFVWFLQTLFLMGRMMEYRTLPMTTMFETLFFYAWLLVTLSIVLGRLLKMDLIVFGVNVLSFVVMLLTLFSDDYLKAPNEIAMVRAELIFIHVTMAIASYIFFTVSAILALSYLLLHRQLKRKKWTALTRRLPSLAAIEHYMFWTATCGLPLLVINVLLAVIWNAQQMNVIIWNDPKIWNTLLVALAYVFFMFQAWTKRAPGTTLAVYNLLAMLFVVLNYFVSNFTSEFHNWIWQ
jgi:HemX protein